MPVKPKKKPPIAKTAKTSPVATCSCDTNFARTLERKVNDLRRFVELADCMVMYASPARKRVWYVASHKYLLKAVDKSLRGHAVEFSSPHALAGLVDELDPMVGDTRTYKRAKCKDASHSLCYADCSKLPATTGYSSYKSTDGVKYKECARDATLPETATCTETYSLICTRRYYSDDNCQTEASSTPIKDWNCT